MISGTAQMDASATIGSRRDRRFNMKYSECNPRQKKAYANIQWACAWLIGGLENTLADNDPESEEYKSAQRQLADHEGLVETVYDMAINDVYGEGFSCYSSSILRDIRFCGKEWLMARCEARVKKFGY